MDKLPTAPDEVMVAKVEPTRADRIVLHRWFIPLAGLLAILGGLALWMPPDSLVRTYAWFLGYMSVACTFVPLPTTWLICALAGPMGFSPHAVATIGAVGTCIANMNDYYLVTWLYRFRPVRRIRYSRLYKRLASWYGRAPFAALTAASFLPIPVDVVRLLAISEGYSRPRFVAASFLGRWPRYLLLALLTKKFNLGWQWIAAILFVTVIIGLWRGTGRLAAAIRRRRTQNVTLTSEEKIPDEIA